MGHMLWTCLGEVETRSPVLSLGVSASLLDSFTWTISQTHDLNKTTSDSSPPASILQPVPLPSK